MSIKYTNNTQEVNDVVLQFHDDLYWACRRLENKLNALDVKYDDDSIWKVQSDVMQACVKIMERLEEPEEYGEWDDEAMFDVEEESSSCFDE